MKRLQGTENLVKTDKLRILVGTNNTIKEITMANESKKTNTNPLEEALTRFVCNRCS